MIINSEALKDSADIVEIIEHYIPIKKVGVGFSAICPFHNEKTASLMISPQKQIFKCFSCNKGGDVIEFVKLFLHCDFNEACEQIAKVINFKLEYKEGVNRNKFNIALEKINNVFKNLLKNKERVKQYLLNRGLSADDLDNYDIGYIGSAQELLQNGLNEGDLIALGMTKKINNDIVISQYARISFALKNSSGKIIGFATRSHPYGDFKNAPKYINPKESTLYKKQTFLYLLYLARSHIIESESLFIVEGYMDAIALHKLGYKNAVATGGTAFTLSHLAQILKINKNIKIIFLFDFDKAGSQATKRAIDLLYRHGFFNIQVARILNKIKEHPAKDVGEVLEKGINLELKLIHAFEYYIKFIFKHAQSAQAKDSALKELRDFINTLQFYQRMEFIEIASNVLKISSGLFQGIEKVAKVAKTFSTLAEQVLKGVLLDGGALYRAREFLHGGELYELKETYNYFNLTGKLDDKAREIVLNPHITPLTSTEALKALKRSFYVREIERLKQEKFLTQIVYLQEKLRELDYKKI